MDIGISEYIGHISDILYLVSQTYGMGASGLFPFGFSITLQWFYVGEKIDPYPYPVSVSVSRIGILVGTGRLEAGPAWLVDLFFSVCYGGAA